MPDSAFETAPELDFSQQDRTLAWFREKSMLPAEQFYQLEHRARARAFTVSNVANLDLVSEVWRQIDRSVRDGLTFDQFVEAVGTKLAYEFRDNNGPRRAGELMRRLDTIFRTNMQSAFSAGRYTFNNRPDVKATHPFSRFSAVMDDRTTDECEALDGTVLPTDDSFWASHQPPLHFNCRSDVTALTEEEAKEEGVDDQAPDVEREDPDFGQPLDGFEPDLSTRPAELVNIYEQKQLEAPPPEPTPAPTEDLEEREAGLREREKAYVDRPVEWGTVIDERGRPLFENMGNKNSVEFHDHQMREAAGHTLTHNHPSGTTLSNQDVFMASANNLGSIRAVGRSFLDGKAYVFEMKPGTSNESVFGGKWPDWRDLKAMHAKAGRWVQEMVIDPELRRMAQAGQTAVSLYDDWRLSYLYSHEAMKKLAEWTGLEYTRTELKEAGYVEKVPTMRPGEFSRRRK